MKRIGTSYASYFNKKYKRDRDILVKDLIKKSQLSLWKNAEILGIKRK